MPSGMMKPYNNIDKTDTERARSQQFLALFLYIIAPLRKSLIFDKKRVVIQ